MFPEQFPSLQTARLVLRQIAADDKTFIFQGLSDPSVVRYYGVSFATLEATDEQMKWYKQLWEDHTGIWWAICDQKSQAFLGVCGYYEYLAEHRKIELGYWLLPQYWGKGYAQEALQAIIAYAFEVLQLERIEAFVEEGNEASDKALVKQGFHYEGTMRNSEYKHGKFINLKVFGLLSSD